MKTIEDEVYKDMEQLVTEVTDKIVCATGAFDGDPVLQKSSIACIVAESMEQLLLRLEKHVLRELEK